MPATPSSIIILTSSFKVGRLDYLLSPLTELRDIALSLRYSNSHDILAVFSSIVSTKLNSIALIFCDSEFIGDEASRLRWGLLEEALCRLSELRRSWDGGRITLNVYSDDELFVNNTSELAGRGEYLPLFQEVGVVNVHTNLDSCDVDDDAGSLDQLLSKGR